MDVCVFGLGYVGSVSAACLAQLGHHVVGVDVNTMKVDLINSGKSPVIEAQLDGMISDAVASGRLRATACVAEAVQGADVMLICVGTPSNGNGNLDFQYLDRVCTEIGEALAASDGYPVVVIRSTVLPGSTEARFIPLLEEAAGLRAGQDFGVAFNPEFLREGTAVDDFHHPPYHIIGHNDERAGRTAAALYEGVAAETVLVPLSVAEMLKYVNNAFHALKVTFANEIGNICKRQGVDSHVVMDLFCRDDKLNLSPYYLKPGFAFGGSCLPKDLRALLYYGHRLDLRLPVLEAILPSNELQIQQAYDIIKQTGHKRVGALGFSFKAGTDDLRESPMVELIEQLIGKGYQVALYDRNVSLARLHGSNRAYIEQEIPHIASLMRTSAAEVVSGCDVIVLGNREPEFQGAVAHTRADQVIIDLVRCLPEAQQVPGQYIGLCW